MVFIHYNVAESAYGLLPCDEAEKHANRRFGRHQRDPCPALRSPGCPTWRIQLRDDRIAPSTLPPSDSSGNTHNRGAAGASDRQFKHLGLLNSRPHNHRNRTPSTA